MMIQNQNTNKTKKERKIKIWTKIYFNALIVLCKRTRSINYINHLETCCNGDNLDYEFQMSS